MRRVAIAAALLLVAAALVGVARPEGAHAVDSAARHIAGGKVALEEFDALDMIEVAPLAGDQAVDDADAMAAPDELFGEMGSDEARAAGNEV